MPNSQMAESPSVSVIVPVYGGWADLILLLSDIADSGVEIVVVDDASPDDGAALFRNGAYGKRCKLVRRSDNGGFAAAVNTGMREASGDVLALINSDARLGTDVLLASAELAWTRQAI